MLSNDAQCALKILSDNNRMKIVSLIAKKEYCGCDLLKELNISQSTLSYHMKALETCGLVNVRKDNKWCYYSLNKSSIMEIIKILNDLI